MKLTQADYEERKARMDAGAADDEDARLVKLYEREGFSWDGSNTGKSSDSTKSNESSNETDSPSNVRMMAPRSRRRRTAGSTAKQTGGSGQTSESSGATE